MLQSELSELKERAVRERDAAPPVLRNAEGLTLDDVHREFLAKHLEQQSRQLGRLGWLWLALGGESVLSQLALLVCGIGWIALGFIALGVIAAFVTGNVAVGSAALALGLLLGIICQMGTDGLRAWRGSIQRRDRRGRDRRRKLVREMVRARRRLQKETERRDVAG